MLAIIYGNKEVGKSIKIKGINGRFYLRTNIHYYITKQQFEFLRASRKSLREISNLIDMPGDARQLHTLAVKSGWDIGEKVITDNRKTKVNESFFKEFTRDSAWVYGWILTDGYVDPKLNQIKLALKSTDRPVLEKIKNIIRYTGDIRNNTTKDGRRSSTLCICRKNMVNDLFELGIAKVNKTFNTVFPDVSDQCFGDLMRGIFEGDGNIRHRTGNTDALDITLSGATKQFMLDIQTALSERGIFMSLYTRKANSCSGNKKEVYTLNTKSNADALRLCYFMYAKTDDRIRLRRKFEVYQNYMNTYYDKVKRRSEICGDLVELGLQNIA